MLKGPLPTELTAATLMLYSLPNTRSFAMMYLSVLVRWYVILLLLIITIYSVSKPLCSEQSTSPHVILLAVAFSGQTETVPVGALVGAIED